MRISYRLFLFGSKIAIPLKTYDILSRFNKYVKRNIFQTFCVVKTAVTRKKLSSNAYMSFLYSSACVPYVAVALCEKNDDKYSFQELSLELKRKLQPVREKLSKIGKLAPLLVLKVDQNDSMETHVIEFAIPSQGDITGALFHWLKILSNGGKLVSIVPKSEISDQEGDILLLSSSKDSSILISKTPTNSITIYKDGGYTSQDLNNITEGYKSALINSLPSSSSSSSSSRRTKDEGTSIFKRFLIDDPLHIQKEEDHDIDYRNNDINSELQALGLQLFDRNSNEGLSWDSLAGYDDVKKDIEDTIINSIKVNSSILLIH